jgi:hypothetical protein
MSVCLAHVDRRNTVAVAISIHKGLLDDAVDGHADDRVARAVGHRDGGVDVEADALERSDESIQGLQRRCRSQGVVVGRVVAAAQQHEDALGFRHDVARVRACRVQRLA